MNTRKLGLRERIAAYPAALAFVLLYLPLLGFVLATISFSAEDAARKYIEQVAHRPPAPLPPLPVVHFVAWPDSAMQRDPFQSLASSSTRAPSESTAR